MPRTLKLRETFAKYCSYYRRITGYCSLCSELEFTHRLPLQIFLRAQILPRRLQIAMSQQVLQGNDVTPALQQARGVRVPEFVQRSIRYVGAFGDVFQPP